jgi:hypothetical protein
VVRPRYPAPRGARGCIVTESATQRAILIRLGALPHTLCARTAATACYLPNGRLHRPLPPGWPDITLIVAGHRRRHRSQERHRQAAPVAGDHAGRLAGRWRGVDYGAAGGGCGLCGHGGEGGMVSSVAFANYYHP